MQPLRLLPPKRERTSRPRAKTGCQRKDSKLFHLNGQSLSTAPGNESSRQTGAMEETALHNKYFVDVDR
ncbi:unnamed protein product [Boreogadus saida]